MTARELIRELQKLPPNQLVRANKNALYPVYRVRIVDYSKDKHVEKRYRRKIAVIDTHRELAPPIDFSK